MSNPLRDQIETQIQDNSIILFMKGTQQQPMCGFSARVVEILRHHGTDFKDINVLTDPQIRVELSALSNWPTIPQLFIKGKLVGGCDIVSELEARGELGDMLKEANPTT
ncbi:MAG: Grx4 family monothiol glutaredoxin [Planctomycetota bacterium]